MVFICQEIPTIIQKAKMNGRQRIIISCIIQAIQKACDLRKQLFHFFRLQKVAQEEGSGFERGLSSPYGRELVF